MLSDYAVHGAVLRRYNRSAGKLSRDGADTVARFQAWLRAADRAVSTVRTYGTVAGEFVAFTGTRGGLARCDATMIEAFVATLTGYQVKTVEQKRVRAGQGTMTTATGPSTLIGFPGWPVAVAIGVTAPDKEAT
jgi:hypothetical protein